MDYHATWALDDRSSWRELNTRPGHDGAVIFPMDVGTLDLPNETVNLVGYISRPTDGRFQRTILACSAFMFRHPKQTFDAHDAKVNSSDHSPSDLLLVANASRDSCDGADGSRYPCFRRRW